MVLVGGPERFDSSDYVEFTPPTEVHDDFREAHQQRQDSITSLSDEELLREREAARAEDEARYNPTSIEEMHNAVMEAACSRRL